MAFAPPAEALCRTDDESVVAVNDATARSVTAS